MGIPEKQLPNDAARARILIVGGDADSRSRLVGHLRRRRHSCTHVSRAADARLELAKDRYDLLLVCPTLPDGSGIDLAEHVQTASPLTKTVVLADRRSFNTAMEAMRCGAIDFISTSVAFEELTTRVDSALRRSLDEKGREERIVRMQEICRELKGARRDICDQVDALCRDLGSAWREMTEQLGEVALTTEFRTLLRQELDVEELLRTTLEYLLSKTGPTNAAVFLPDHEGRYSLGAYVNYDCPRESIDDLLDHLCDAICPQMAEESDLVVFEDAREFAEWIGAADGFVANSQVISFACRHDDECLATVVLFRNEDHPFDPAIAATLDMIRSIFAEQLAHVIHIHHRAMPEWPADSHGDEHDLDDEYGFGFEGGLAA